MAVTPRYRHATTPQATTACFFVQPNVFQKYVLGLFYFCTDTILYSDVYVFQMFLSIFPQFLGYFLFGTSRHIPN